MMMPTSGSLAMCPALKQLPERGRLGTRTVWHAIATATRRIFRDLEFALCLIATGADSGT